MKQILDLAGLEGLPIEESAKAVSFLIEALAQVDLVVMKTNSVPVLYQAGIRYRGSAVWADAISVMRDGEASCQSLAAWRIAEARLLGLSANAHVVIFEGERLFHIEVTVAGVREDPSSLVFPH